MLFTKGFDFNNLDFLKLPYLLLSMADAPFITEIRQLFFENLNHLCLKTLHFMENRQAAVQKCS